MGGEKKVKRGRGGGGVEFVMNGKILKVEERERIIGGGGGERIIDNVKDEEMGGGGGIGIILNKGKMVVEGYVRGGRGGKKK